MLRSLYTAATGMEAQQLKMDTIANNLANANTVGYKKTRADFEDLMSETLVSASAADPRGGASPTALQVGLGVRPGTTSKDLSQGDMQTTNNQLDIAIQGQGYFRVQQQNGEYAYTRAGNLTVDSQGRVVTQTGELLEPAITVPAQTTQLKIDSSGNVTATVAGNTAATTQVGQIELANFVNPNGMVAIGNNLLQETEASGQAIMSKPGEQGSGLLAQGQLETSNVQAVNEMIDMISTQRAYEMNSKVIQTADQMLQKLTSLR